MGRGVGVTYVRVGVARACVVVTCCSRAVGVI